MTFLDGNRITPGTEGCRCTIDCEYPCWQRVGLTTKACCPTCAPLELHDVDDEHDGGHDDGQVTGQGDD